jgi:hypothetical protein
MNSLHETQRHFTNYTLRDLGQDLAAEGIKSNGLTAQQRLAIYRNNTQLGLTEALRDGYPVVNKLVGTEFFNHLARKYICRHPPKAGCLLSFGGQFADFIAAFEPASGLPYLPDVARLEWYWHEAFHEADANSLAISTLAKVDPATYGKLGFTLHPSARLLTSAYPILKIWQSNQKGYESDVHIHLDEGGCRLLIYRLEWDVVIFPMQEVEYQFLNFLAMELTLIQALEQVMAKEPHFAVQAVLQHWLNNGLLTDIYYNH